MNSDVVFYQRNRDGSLGPVRKNMKPLGHMVLSKALGSNGRREITDAYKIPEGKTTGPTSLLCMKTLLFGTYCIVKISFPCTILV